MKVLLLNGSPRSNGCTYTALCEIAATLQAEGIESEIFHLGTRPVRGCIACGQCAGKNRCIFDDDCVNALIAKAQEADAFIVGSPVYYASANGAAMCVLDRLFYAGGRALAYKPAAAIASARRAGTTATLDILNKYFMINNMPIVSSQYWNMVHGQTPEQVQQDAEGLQVMRQLARNMAWMLRCLQAGKEHGVAMPTYEERVRTNFIR